MSSSKHANRPKCNYENCGSTRFSLGDDGYTYCHRGHQQSERGTVILADPGELTKLGQKARRRGGESDGESVATSRASGFSGLKAFEHYLLCVQLVLRKQVKWLVENRGLPQELETLVRDLWTLRLQKLQHRISYDSETETEGTQSQQFFSSQSEGETSASEASHRQRKIRKGKNGTPSLAETLSLCYTALLLLCEPVTVADVYAWVTNGKLLYYHAAKDIPLGMRERLPATYQDLLEPGQLGKPEKLHKRVLDTLTLLNDELGMAIPAINAPLVLYRWVRELGFPVEVFVATLRLGRVLDVDFSFKLDGDGVERDLVLRYPEARLMALLVVVTKLLFPSDGRKRYPVSAADLSALGLDWSGWVTAHSEASRDETAQRRLSHQDMMNYSQSDALQAADEQLDHYMDWLEHNVASEEPREQGQAGKDAEFRRTLFRLFPVERKSDAATIVAPQANETPDQTVSERLHRIQGALKPKRVVDATDGAKEVLRMGSLYRRYRNADDLDGPVGLFYERAAGLAGLSVEGMVRVVFLMERKVQKHEESLRKGGGESSDDE
ncbi:hypothetical protein LTR08_000168 [Meristemomyces frigidus]|nr:hypothetical protein LTR08_000168 [Meristemomyces frigidus]